ncbi:adenylate/guanylate cyclase domain-containing protein [Leekyejoonella antrihumi]|uniref:adenylate/guanylate cyclase domain-containing protein n=1 Tax=Leekyejoonella antrihumi TaxID=1660198 RepID=UPI0016486A0D|nr:adenylate/guanylate cyclase domain-containing protein [Leekyejoonella antrihumi]
MQAAWFCSNGGAAIAQGGQRGAGAQARGDPLRRHRRVDIAGGVGQPGALRANLSRYFDAVSKVVWSHGGTVEKVIGDAVVAVFGVPVSREDDALRAVRSAGRIHERVAELSGRMRAQLGQGLKVRIGVNQGEVFVTHRPDGQFSVTGDPVNVAARLEAAAGPGETYVGDTLAALVAARCHCSPSVRCCTTVRQCRSRSIGSPTTRGHDGRAPHRLRRAGRRARRPRDHRRSHREAWTGLVPHPRGEPGIGKHRLASHFLAGRDGLRVLRGSAQPLATDGPLAKLLGQLGDD